MFVLFLTFQSPCACGLSVVAVGVAMVVLEWLSEGVFGIVFTIVAVWMLAATVWARWAGRY